MSHTFEELVLREIDSLYHGALFLSGGDPAEAESLLVRAVGSAFHAEIGTAAGSQHWLEERLVHTFVTNRSASGSTLPPGDGPKCAGSPGSVERPALRGRPRRPSRGAGGLVARASPALAAPEST